MLVESASGDQWVSQSDLTTEVGEKVFADSLDFAAVPDLVGREEEARQQDLQPYKYGELLTDSQVFVAVREISHRLSAGSLPDRLVVLLLKVALRTGHFGDEVKSLTDRKQPTLILAVVHALKPQHYSLLVVKRASKEAEVTVNFFDTLPNESMYMQARQTLHVILATAGLPKQALPGLP